MSEKGKIKLCPFCGSKAKLNDKLEDNWVNCTKCDAEAPLKSWNMRSNDDLLTLRASVSNIAHEAHMMGRVYHAGGERANPVEVYKEIEKMIKVKLKETP